LYLKKKKRKLKDEEFFEQPAELQESNDFDQMNVSKPFMKAINLLGFQKPTPIQQAVIPTALMGKDICACAVTG
jgi:ATP-dependent RNA helicase DDX27